MNLRHSLLAAAILAAPLQAPLASPARAAATETFLGCPAGFGMVAAPDPRQPGSAQVLSATTTGQPLVVQCLALQPAGPPSCPAGTILRALTGPDLCRASQRRPSSSSTIADGTSNTISAGSASSTGPTSISDGTSNTISMTSASQPPSSSQPVCAAPAVLAVDPSGQLADGCLIRTVTLPTDRVPVTR